MLAKARSFRPRAKSARAPAHGGGNDTDSLSELSSGALAASIRAGEQVATRRVVCAARQLYGEVAAAILASSSTGADIQHEVKQPRVLNLDAVRGDDGQCGLEIMDDPSLGIYNVIVAVLPGSRAHTDGLFLLGDVVLEVDGIPLMQDNCVVQVRNAMKAGEQRYAFKVLRATEQLFSEEEAATPSGARGAESAAPGSPKRCKVHLQQETSVSEGALAAEPMGVGGVQPCSSEPLFLPDTPRSTIFAHAAALKERHLKLARAQRNLSLPLRHEDAMESSLALSGHPAAVSPDISLNIYRSGSSFEDWSLCV